MMDLSFTKDPNWISQRELQWKEIENIYREGSTRKEVMALKNYFMTGENPASLISVSSIIKLFPAFTVEGIQYCLNNYVSSSISDEQLERIQQVLANQDFVVGVTPEKKKDIFEFTFGRVYEKRRAFPFLISNEVLEKEISLSSNYLIESGTGVYSFIKRNKKIHTNHWLRLHDFLFSLFSFVDKRIYHEDAQKVGRVGGIAVDIIRSRLDYIMNACFKLPNPSENPEDDQERIVYLSEFRLRMDALEGPVELKQIWESIKAKYQ